MTVNEKSITLDPDGDVRLDLDPTDTIVEHRDDIFFAAIQTTRMPMLVTDPRREDNPIVFANRAFVAMTGYSIDRLIGQNCRFLQGPATDEHTIDEIRAAITERRECNVEILNYRADGSSFWNALFISPVYDKSGTLVYFFASQLDVSRRRDAEEALTQAQKMEALGQLTGGIAHDFNNLLQVMAGQIELLERRVARESDPQKIVRGVGLISDAVDKASRLTQQLLAFSRKQSLRGRVINLNTLLRGMEELIARAVGGEILVSYELDPALMNCEVDTTQFETSILNLLVNARDAMAGGGSVRISTGNVEVDAEDARTFTDLEPGTYASVCVEDNGEGIPAELVARVMDPFFTTKEEGRGTGLGLSMVYGFTKQSRGTTRIYSEEGEGTTVRLLFPVTRAAIGPTKTVPRQVERGGSERILVVDDRFEVGEVAVDLLSELGYAVEFCAGAREALELLERLDQADRPRIVFSDVVMPGGMNGYSLARAIQSAYPSMHVLLTSGFDRDFATTDEAGAAHFEVIRKPYRLTELARRIRAILDGPTGSQGSGMTSRANAS